LQGCYHMSTEERVIKVIAYVLGIKWHSELHSLTVITSLECYKALEEEFNVTFYDYGITSFLECYTVKEVCDYIDITSKKM